MKLILCHNFKEVRKENIRLHGLGYRWFIDVAELDLTVLRSLTPDQYPIFIIQHEPNDPPRNKRYYGQIGWGILEWCDLEHAKKYHLKEFRKAQLSHLHSRINK